MGIFPHKDFIVCFKRKIFSDPVKLIVEPPGNFPAGIEEPGVLVAVMLIQKKQCSGL